MLFDLKGRNALVTGAGQGVGAGIARLLASQGATVTVNDLHQERAEATVDDVSRAGGRAATALFDVTDLEAVEQGVARIEADLGPIDILVNNAGVPEGMGIAQFVDLDPSEWRRYIDLNVYGVMNGARAVIPGMIERGHGRIVTISSGAGTTGIGLGVSAYGAGKGGGIAFMRHLALEVAGSGVTANTIAIGLQDNPGDPELTRLLAESIPVGRLGKPEDVGACVVWLASDEASWVTGQTIEVNGGSLTT
jgi:3-oxoacyl-[acyl-carrier protein] reductase